MGTELDEKYWKRLLYYIEKGQCTPFLGAGAAAGLLPLGGEVAKKLAKENDYPMEDDWNLQRVSQFIAIGNDFVYPKDIIADMFKKIPEPDFDDPGLLYNFLAKLKLPIYITTNYDDYMAQALKHQGVEPVREICRWKDDLKIKLSQSIFESDYEPTPDNPLVFHLHGHIEDPQSMVLTEDDYLDYMVYISEHFVDMIPKSIQGAISDSVLLFLGYSLADLDFRVLFRSFSENLAKSSKRSKVSVQLLPSVDNIPDKKKSAVKNYLDAYYKHLDIDVYWGTCREFLTELKKHWEERHDND